MEYIKSSDQDKFVNDLTYKLGWIIHLSIKFYTFSLFSSKYHLWVINAQKYLYPLIQDFLKPLKFLIFIFRKTVQTLLHLFWENREKVSVGTTEY